jgi:hypothetical protein
MSRRNAESLKERLEIMDPIMVGYDPMNHRDAFRTLYKIFSQARKDGEEIFVDITSTTNLTQGVALTITLMFRNARVYTVPSKQPAWYVNGRIGDERFEKWFENARKKEVEVEQKVLNLLHSHGGSADSISDIIRWSGYKAASSTLRNRYSRIINRLEMKGLVDADKGSKMKIISLTEFGTIFAEALSDLVDV